jgi:hypothetical protein
MNKSSAQYSDQLVNDQGQTTKYQLEQFDQGDKKIYVLSEHPDNQGPGFDDVRTRDRIAQEAAAIIQGKDGIRANEVELYQQKPTGEFDKVDFRYEAANSVNESWRETQRVPQPREQLEKDLQAIVAAPDMTPQQVRQANDIAFNELTGPRMNRAAELDTQHQIDVQAQKNQENDQQQMQQTITNRPSLS